MAAPASVSKGSAAVTNRDGDAEAKPSPLDGALQSRMRKQTTNSSAVVALGRDAEKKERSRLGQYQLRCNMLQNSERTIAAKKVYGPKDEKRVSTDTQSPTAPARDKFQSTATASAACHAERKRCIKPPLFQASTWMTGKLALLDDSMANNGSVNQAPGLLASQSSINSQSGTSGNGNSCEWRIRPGDDESFSYNSNASYESVDSSGQRPLGPAMTPTRSTVAERSTHGRRADLTRPSTPAKSVKSQAAAVPECASGSAAPLAENSCPQKLLTSKIPVYNAQNSIKKESTKVQKSPVKRAMATATSQGVFSKSPNKPKVSQIGDREGEKPKVRKFDLKNHPKAVDDEDMVYNKEISDVQKFICEHKIAPFDVIANTAVSTGPAEHGSGDMQTGDLLFLTPLSILDQLRIALAGILLLGALFSGLMYLFE